MSMTIAENTPALTSHPSQSEDTPEARQYSRIRRWLSVFDTSLGIVFLIVLLATGWTGDLRDVATRMAREHYVLAVFFYVLLLTIISKGLSLALDIYSFRLENRFHLSNQSTGAWIVDELKGWVVGLVLISLLTELVYWIIRSSPQHWWLISWAAFTALFVVFAQLAPVILFPIFYKFVPLENQALRDRLVRLSERAGTHGGSSSLTLSCRTTPTTRSKPCSLTNSVITYTGTSSKASCCRWQSHSLGSGLRMRRCGMRLVREECSQRFPISPIYLCLLWCQQRYR